jgi:hypothetical protein
MAAGLVCNREWTDPELDADAFKLVRRN